MCNPRSHKFAQVAQTEVLKLEFSDLELLASRNGPIPKGIDALDQATYLSLRNLYSQFGRRTITAAEAARDKRIIKTTHERMKQKASFEHKCFGHSVQLWKQAEQAANTYQKDRTIENADRLIGAIYGVGFPREEATPCQPNA